MRVFITENSGVLLIKQGGVRRRLIIAVLLATVAMLVVIVRVGRVTGYRIVGCDLVFTLMFMTIMMVVAVVVVAIAGLMLLVVLNIKVVAVLRVERVRPKLSCPSSPPYCLQNLLLPSPSHYSHLLHVYINIYIIYSFYLFESFPYLVLAPSTVHVHLHLYYRHVSE